MKRLSFVCGSSLRKVVIDGRKISMMSQETGFIPVSFDLDKMDSKSQIKKIKGKMGQEGLDFIKQVALLNTEEEMEKDIIKDFQLTGWRRIRRDGNN